MLHRRRFLVADARLRQRLPRIALAAAAMAATLWLVQHNVFNPADLSRGLRWVGLAVLVGGGCAVYGAAGLALGAFDTGELMGRLRRRRPA